MEPNATPTPRRWDSVKLHLEMNAKKYGVVAVAFGTVVVAGILGWRWYDNNRVNFIKPSYSTAYSLVSDTISKSASIVLHLPPSISKEEAKTNTIFTPNIHGEWLPVGTETELAFKPSKPLSVGKHYAVTIQTASGKIGKDFLVEDDPQVVALFPRTDSEAHEKSSITVVFNRPMVPVTSLDVLQDKDMPLKVTPSTQGKYKWIGTRTVQFIPTERLTRSSNYTVEIAASMVSGDGVAVESLKSHFETRKLRYAYINDGPTVYNQPVSIRFNQPVDLNKTKQEIRVHNTTTDKPVDVDIQYGKTQKYNEKTKKYDAVEDTSTIDVIQKADSHGRKDLWDFTNQYSVTIKKAYPAEGDIDLNESREIAIQVTDIIDSVSAISDRSSLVRQDFFDPRGKLVLKFFEPVNTLSSIIEAPNLTKIEYGQKCDGDTVDYPDSPCPKVEDHQTLLLSFNANALGKSQEVTVNLKKIVNEKNFKINIQTIPITIRTVPELHVLRSVPDSTTSTASVSDFSLCTNSPLVTPDAKHISDFIRANPIYEFKSWGNSFYIPNDTEPDTYRCLPGQFETDIVYGLMPESDYTLSFNLTDQFGSQSNYNVNLKTGTVPGEFVNFYHLQQEYNTTIPSRTELTYAAENMGYVNVNLCRLSPESMLYHLNNKPSYVEGSGAISDCLESVNKKIDLPKRYWIKNYFTVNIKDFVSQPLGHYVLTFSYPGYTDADGNEVYERSYVTVTNLSMVEKKVEVWDSSGFSEKEKLGEKNKNLTNVYWVADMTSLSPVRGAQVDLYASKTQNSLTTYMKIASAQTDSRGIARSIPVTELAAAVVRMGDDSAFTYGKIQLSYGSTALSLSKMYVYTDRPIYRPGHVVNIKGIYRFGYDGTYDIVKDRTVNVRVYDSSQNEIVNTTSSVSDFGTFTASTTLPLGAPLGSYRIEVDGQGFGFFDVQEYVSAPFKVDASTDKDEYVNGDTYSIKLNASYYFGAPVEGGTVEYSVTSQNYYFDKYQGDYFQFGRGWYDCYDSCFYGDTFITRGTVDIDAHGNATISNKLDLAKWFPDEDKRGSKIFNVTMTAKNSTGEQISVQKSFVVHAGQYYLGLTASDSFIAKNQAVTVKLKSVDTNGKETAKGSVNINVQKVRWVYNQRQGVDGGYYYSWEKKTDIVKSFNASTDSHGNWSTPLSLEKEGEYEVVARGTDSRGNVIFSSYTLYVYGDSPVEDMRPSNDNSLDIVADETSVQVGDMASFIIKSPYKHAKALISLERGNVYTYDIVDVNESFYRYSFKITDQYVPNVYASVVLLSDKPEVKFGQVAYFVNTKTKELSISVVSDKPKYLPGEEVTLSFTVKDSSGKPVAAEFSAAVVDESILALKGNPKKNPVMFFYDGFPLTVSTMSNVKNILYKVDLPVGTKGGAGGGGDPSDLSGRKRGEFKDTAYWRSDIKTDSYGKATVRFTLPDNLTTWQVEAVGVTKNTFLGVGYSEFMANKNIMVVPLKPRFVLPGDEFMVGAKVFNRTDSRQSLKVAFKSDSLQFVDKSTSLSVSLPPQGTQTVYFKVKAPENRLIGTHSFVVSAANKAYNDTVELTIPINPNDTYETFATANYTTDPSAQESVFIPRDVVAGKGELTIKNSATLAVFLSDSIAYMLDFPYYSCEEIGSKLETIAILKRASKLKNYENAFPVSQVTWKNQKMAPEEAVQAGLKDIYRLQNTDGGFLYYPYSYSAYSYYRPQSNLGLSVHMAKVFSELKAAGFAVDELKLQQLYNYLSLQATKGAYGDVNVSQYNNDTMIVVASALSRLKGHGSLDGSVVKRIKEITKDEAYIKETGSTHALEQLVLLISDMPETFNFKLAKPVLKTLENRIQIDSRGAYLGFTNDLMWEYYETPVQNTANFIRVLTHANRDNAIVDKMFRWLLASRAKDGSWGSTPATLSVIDAFTDYLQVTKENESNFTLATAVRGQEKNSFNFATGTVASQNIFAIPMEDLPKEQITSVEFTKTAHNSLSNAFYYDMALRYYLPVKAVPPRDEGFAITRGIYRIDDKDNARPLNSGHVGDVLKVHDTIIVPRSRNYVSIEDYIFAGAEIVNTNLATENQNIGQDYSNDPENAWKEYEPEETTPLYPSEEEVHDDRVYATAMHLEPGTYTYDYYIRLLIPGTFQVLPAQVNEKYFPENFGRTGGGTFVVTQ